MITGTTETASCT